MEDKNHNYRKTRKTLIEKIGNDCESSWLIFFDLYRGFICSIARRLGVANGDIDDVMQKIFVEVHADFKKENTPNFRERSFGSWLGQKVKWRVGEYHRHRHRRENPTAPEDLNPGGEEPFEEIWKSDWNSKKLELALSRVPQKPRNLQIFHALAIEETSVEEVCKRFDISQSNAETIKSRVKSDLKPILEEIEAGEI